MKGNQFMVEDLLELKADPNKTTVPSRLGPLHMAASKNFDSICHSLLEYGAISTYRNSSGHTPSQTAHVAGHRNLAFLLNKIEKGQRWIQEAAGWVENDVYDDSDIEETEAEGDGEEQNAEEEKGAPATTARSHDSLESLDLLLDKTRRLKETGGRGGNREKDTNIERSSRLEEARSRMQPAKEAEYAFKNPSKEAMRLRATKKGQPTWRPLPGDPLMKPDKPVFEYDRSGLPVDVQYERRVFQSKAISYLMTIILILLLTLTLTLTLF